MTNGPDAPPSRGHRKREKTRSQLIRAGLRVLAEKGEGLTASDVVAEADVSNGTFYNYFEDREALFAALAEHLALSLAEAAAREPVADPALRFALATGRVLQRAAGDPVWARVLLRLVGRPAAGLEIGRYLREDLAEGLARGRFAFGPDPATLDLLTGLVAMTIRRLVDAAEPERDEVVERGVERGLLALGLAPDEARRIAFEGMALAATRAESP